MSLVAVHCRDALRPVDTLKGHQHHHESLADKRTRKHKLEYAHMHALLRMYKRLSLFHTDNLPCATVGKHSGLNFTRLTVHLRVVQVMFENS